MCLHFDIAAQSLDEWNKMIDLNCKGILNGVKAVLEDMKNLQCGTIINISSLAGKRTAYEASIYCGTKFFVHSVTECMRSEMESNNIRFITIEPGAVVVLEKSQLHQQNNIIETKKLNNLKFH